MWSKEEKHPIRKVLPCPLQAHIYSSYFFPFFVHSAASEHSSFKSFSFLLVSFLLAWVYPWAARSSMVHVPTMGSPWVPDSGGLHLPQHFVPFLKYISLVPTRGQSTPRCVTDSSFLSSTLSQTLNIWEWPNYCACFVI